MLATETDTPTASRVLCVVVAAAAPCGLGERSRQPGGRGNTPYRGPTFHIYTIFLVLSFGFEWLVEFHGILV